MSIKTQVKLEEGLVAGHTRSLRQVCGKACDSGGVNESAMFSRRISHELTLTITQTITATTHNYRLTSSNKEIVLLPSYKVNITALTNSVVLKRNPFPHNAKYLGSNTNPAFCSCSSCCARILVLPAS